MKPQKTYFLVPDFHFKAGTGPVALGNIISDPFRPHRVLTTITADTIENQYPRVEKITDFDRKMGQSSERDLTMSVWAHFVQVASAKVSGQRGDNLHVQYDMNALETSYFVVDPTRDEIQRRLAEPEVKAALEPRGIFRKRSPVYMISGLKIAKGFTASEESGKTHSVEAEVSGSVPTPGGDVGLGTNVHRSSSSTQSSSWRMEEDIVFAYQLLKVELQGRKGQKLKYDEFRHKAAFLSQEEDDGDEDEEEDEDEGLSMEWKAVADPQDLQDTAAFRTAALSSDGAEVVCIYL